MASRAAILRAARAGSPGAGQLTAPPQGSGSPWIGQLPSYSMEPGSGYSYSYGPFLPRPGQTFTQGAFGPFSPILPVPVDMPPDGSPRAQPRRWQPFVGYNLPVGEPGNEGYKLASFSTLKSLADTYSILRTCLERRKNEIRALDWDIVLTQDAAKRYQGDRAAMRDFGERQAQAKKFFSRPDPNYYNFESFLHAMMDQVFVIDALSLYMCPKRGRGMGRGLLGSDLDGLWLLDGSTIRPLLDLHGGTPQPPAPGFQQYLYGVPRSDLSMMVDGLDLQAYGLSEADVRSNLRSDQLIYHPYLQRPDTPYGFSLVEQALIPIMTGLRKQAYQLSFFDESTVPKAYISPGDSTLTPNQLRELQDALNATAGDLSWAFKIQVLPPGSKVTPQKEMEIVDQADDWIANEVAMACDITPVEIGLLPNVSTVASPFAAREMAQASRSIHERTSTRPILSYITSIFDFLLQQVCGQDDLRFVFNGMEQTQDLAALTDMGIKQVQSGIRSIDEVRDDLHLPPWDLPETSGPIVLTQMGPVPLGEAAMDTVAQMRQAITGAHDAAGAGKKPRRALPAGTSGQGRMNGPVTQRQARRGGALAPAHATGEGAPGHSGGKPGVMSRVSSKAVLAELEALGRHLGKGMPAAEWVPEHIPGAVMSVITEDLDKGLSAGYVLKAAAALVTPAQETPQQQEARAREQQVQLAARFQAGLSAAFAAALAAARGLIAAWWAGTLAVTAATLAAMIGEEIRQALLGALTGLWTQAWEEGAAAAGGTPDVNALDAFLAAYGGHWAALISGTGQDDLVAAIRAALTAGDPQAILGALEGLLSDARAERIAVSEVTRAWNAAALLAMKAAGLAYVRWQTRNDSRVCPKCMANQNASPVAIDSLFPSGTKSPPLHPLCRCTLLPSGPPPPVVAGKVLRREVGLNGQETWTETGPQPDVPAGGGGRVFQPHRADGAMGPDWGSPGAMTGGEPPRWDGSEPAPVVERSPDADDDAAYGEAAGPGARPGTYWPAPYMDGWWPSPHGHGTGQAPSSSPGAANGRPPNGVGKTARVSAGLKSKAVPARVVYNQMRDNFPDKAIRWILGATWVIADVPHDLIDYHDEPKWAASHQPAHVRQFIRAYEAGERVSPPVMVDEPGHQHLVVVDGHHRTLARRKMGKPAVRAYIGTVSRRGGPALRTYQLQHHSGSDPQNKSFTAGNLGVPGNVSGLTPLTVEGQRQGPYVAGLAVRAADTGRVLMLQRAVTDSDPAAGLWELPGGHAETGESLLAAAVREWQEETGRQLPAGEMTGFWDAGNGIYQGFVFTIPREDGLDLSGPREVANPDGDAFEAVAWHDPELINGNPAVRPELRADYARFMAALDSRAVKSGGPAVLADYWTHHGHPGPTRYAFEEQIRWGEPGDFDRCTGLLVEHGHMTEDQAHGYCNRRHHEALGYYPATHARMEREGG